MNLEEISEAPPNLAPPASDYDRPRRRRGKRSWALLALMLTSVIAACVSVLSFQRVSVLRSELSALRSEIFQQREEGNNGMAQQNSGKMENRQEEHSSSGPEPCPKSQQEFQPCLQMIGDRSRSAVRRGVYIELPWQTGLRRGTVLQEEENAILVREDGFYFIYSQVYYTDKTFVMGHVLQRKQRVVGEEIREDVLFRCIQNMDRDIPDNTCYTGGIVRLEAGDQVELLIPRQSANVSLDGDATFFGAVRLA